ncbi:MAG: hypothetical protein AAF378_23505, partial [Cyanobacteria bacterium P01_A01_bin.84]
MEILARLFDGKICRDIIVSQSIYKLVPDSLLDNRALRDLAADLCKDVRLDVTTVLAIAFADRS